ncbi:MAG TPA: hypothetical protein VE690_07185 [Rhodopila sp.]|nr:hypothetical protein [Rhodopila sp.]
MTSQDRTCGVLAYVLTGGLFGLVTFLMFHGLPPGSMQRNMLSLVMGALLTGWTAMISYYFGCANGSVAKDLLLHQSAPKRPLVARDSAGRVGAGSMAAAPVPVADRPVAGRNPNEEAPAPVKNVLPDARPVAAALVAAVTIPGLTDALRAAAPAADLGRWLPALQGAMEHWRITEPRRVAAALGQFAAEAGEDFGRLTENLNYTTAARIHAVFPQCFPTVAAAEPFCRAPEKLADVVYAHQAGNTDVGDGWRYIGRGLIQLTGKARYQAFATAMGLELADAVRWCATPAGAAMSGCWYLASHGCLELADEWLVDAISRKVNGVKCATLDRRRALSERALHAMTPAMAA